MDSFIALSVLSFLFEDLYSHICIFRILHPLGRSPPASVYNQKGLLRYPKLKTDDNDEHSQPAWRSCYGSCLQKRLVAWLLKRGCSKLKRIDAHAWLLKRTLVAHA